MKIPCKYGCLMMGIMVYVTLIASCSKQDKSPPLIHAGIDEARDPKEKYFAFKEYCVKYFSEFKSTPAARDEYYDDLFDFVSVLCSQPRFFVLTKLGAIEILGEPDDKVEMKDESWWRYNIRKKPSGKYSSISLNFDNNGVLVSMGFSAKSDP